jgi:hypothetical protein
MLTPPDDVQVHHARLRAELAAAGLAPNPQHVLLLAQALAQYDRCTQFLNAHGQVMEIRNDKGEVKSTVIAPEANLQLKLLDKIRQLMKDVGLSAGDADPPGSADASPRSGSRSTAAGQSGDGHHTSRGIDQLRERLATIARPR